MVLGSTLVPAAFFSSESEARGEVLDEVGGFMRVRRHCDGMV